MEAPQNKRFYGKMGSLPHLGHLDRWEGEDFGWNNRGLKQGAIGNNLGEHIGNLKGTCWEPIGNLKGNMLGTKENVKTKIPSPPPPPPKKT